MPVRYDAKIDEETVMGMAFPSVNVYATGKQKAASKKVLVVYFSATETTKSAAQKIKKATGGTLYQIKAAKAYTTTDLNYNNDCRANVEQDDENVRSEIKGKVNNISKYDVIFVSYPIWLAYHNLIQCTQA